MGTRGGELLKARRDMPSIVLDYVGFQRYLRYLRCSDEPKNRARILLISAGIFSARRLLRGIRPDQYRLLLISSS